MTDEFARAFPQLIYKIKKLAATDSIAAEAKALHLMRWVRSNYPNQDIGFAMREELRLLLRDIRIARYQNSSF